MSQASNQLLHPAAVHGVLRTSRPTVCVPRESRKVRRRALLSRLQGLAVLLGVHGGRPFEPWQQPSNSGGGQPRRCRRGVAVAIPSRRMNPSRIESGSWRMSPMRLQHKLHQRYGPQQHPSRMRIALGRELSRSAASMGCLLWLADTLPLFNCPQAQLCKAFFEASSW